MFHNKLKLPKSSIIAPSNLKVLMMPTYSISLYTNPEI